MIVKGKEKLPLSSNIRVVAGNLTLGYAQTLVLGSLRGLTAQLTGLYVAVQLAEKVDWV